MLEILRHADAAGIGNHAHHGRIHFGRRVERFRRHFKQQLHIEKILQHHAQAAVIVAFGRGYHAFHHFFLQHKMHIGHFIGHFAQAKQQRRGNIIRQIADNFLFAGHAAKIKLQHIAFVYHQFIGKGQCFQALDDVAVDFDHIKLIELARQRLGNRRQTGADFNHHIIGRGANGAHNIIDDAGVLQKILPETLAGFMLFHVCQISDFKRVL